MIDYEENTDQLSLNKHFQYEKEPLKEYAHMLHEDIHLGITNSAEKDALNAQLHPQNKSFEKLLCNSFHGRFGHSNEGFSNFIWGLLDEISQQISYHGFVVYELVESKDLKNVFYLRSIRSIYEVKIKKDYVVQYIPKVLQKEGHPEKILIPRNKCFIFQFPKELGGYKKYLKTLETLQKYGSIISFANLELNKIAGKFDDYDFIRHRAIKDVKLWKETSYLNWHHRAYNSSDYGLEHYRSARVMKFRRTIIIIRDQIITDINNMIKKLSKEIAGTKINLTVDGLMSLKEIDKAISKWYSGKMGFDEVSKYL